MKNKVLIIEDDKVVRENTSEILQLANYHVETAKNGKEGISKAKSFLPNIIICDILMPYLDGYGVLQIISKTPTLKQVPFIFLTAKTHQNDLRKGMELGADDYIYKPFEESELLRAIEVRLKRVKAFENKNKIPSLKNTSNYLDLKKIKDVDQYLAKKKVYLFKKDETIYCEGNQSNHIFLIKKGTIKTYKINENGKEFNTGYYTNKQYFGHSSFVKQLPHFENSKAITETQLYKISKDEITSILNNNHHIIFDFINLLTSNTIANNSQLSLLAYGSVRKKTAITLLNLLEEYPSVEGDKIFISRLNLANSVGVAKETLIRTLRDLKEENLIDISAKCLTILNKDRLLKVE
jgi:DNA-binding response OmpR family regulator